MFTHHHHHCCGIAASFIALLSICGCCYTGDRSGQHVIHSPMQIDIFEDNDFEELNKALAARASDPRIGKNSFGQPEKERIVSNASKYVFDGSSDTLRLKYKITDIVEYQSGKVVVIGTFRNDAARNIIILLAYTDDGWMAYSFFSGYS